MTDIEKRLREKEFHTFAEEIDAIRLEDALAIVRDERKQKPQRQDAMRDQMDDLLKIAVIEGMYDAHQFIMDVLDTKRVAPNIKPSEDG